MFLETAEVILEKTTKKKKKAKDKHLEAPDHQMKHNRRCSHFNVIKLEGQRGAAEASAR